MTRGSLTQTEAAILLAVVIFAGFQSVSLVLIGLESVAIAFNALAFVVSLFLLLTDEFAPLDGPAEVSR